MTSSRRPPSFIPDTPWSQPGMTWPAPSGNVNGSVPRSQEASNCSPVDHESPTYWTATTSPVFAALPLPLTMSTVCSPAGGSPAGCATAGFAIRSLLTPFARSAGVVAAGAAVAAGVALCSSESSPHATAVRASRQQARRIGRRRMRGQGRRFKRGSRRDDKHSDGSIGGVPACRYLSAGATRERRGRDPRGRPAGMLRPVFALGAYADEVMADVFPIGEGVTGWVVENRCTRNVERADHDPIVAVVEGTELEPESLVSVPLIVGDRVVAALNVYRLGIGRAFSGAEVEQVEQFATMAALAFDSAMRRET